MMSNNYSKVKDIMLNPEYKIHEKLQSIFEYFTIVMDDDYLINHPIHDFKVLYAYKYNFEDKLFNHIFIELIHYYKSRDLDVANIDCEMVHSPDFGSFLLDTGLSATHTITCSCCTSYVFVDVKVNFDDLTITAKYNKEGTERFRREPTNSEGTAENPCVSIKQENKLIFDFKCRSGAIAIANIMKDLPIYSENEPIGHISINEKFGMIKMMRHWEKHNFLYMQCGNSSPTIFQNKNGEVLLGSLNDECLCDSDPCICVDDPTFDNFEEKGYVCTDLWAVHIVDYDDFKGFENKIDHTILDVSALGNDIVIEYNYDYQNWDSDNQVLLTMKSKKV